MALDLPTQLGLNSNHPLAMAEVGKVGVAINSLQDMEILLDGVPLDRIRQFRFQARPYSWVEFRTVPLRLRPPDAARTTEQKAVGPGR